MSLKMFYRPLYIFLCIMMIQLYFGDGQDDLWHGDAMAYKVTSGWNFVVFLLNHIC